MCNARFARPSHLKTHSKLHESQQQQQQQQQQMQTGETGRLVSGVADGELLTDKKRQCDYCDQRFVLQSQLVAHICHTHNNGTVNKLFK